MRHLEEWAWHQLTDSNQQNGSIGENRIGRSVTRRSQEGGCGDLSEDPSVMSFEYLCRSSQSSGKEGYSPVFIQWVLVHHEHGRRVQQRGYPWVQLHRLPLCRPNLPVANVWGHIFLTANQCWAPPLDVEGRNPANRRLAVITVGLSSWTGQWVLPGLHMYVLPISAWTFTHHLQNTWGSQLHTPPSMLWLTKKLIYSIWSLAMDLHPWNPLISLVYHITWWARGKTYRWLLVHQLSTSELDGLQNTSLIWSFWMLWCLQWPRAQVE